MARTKARVDFGTRPRKLADQLNRRSDRIPCMTVAAKAPAAAAAKAQKKNTMRKRASGIKAPREDLRALVNEEDPPPQTPPGSPLSQPPDSSPQRADASMDEPNHNQVSMLYLLCLSLTRFSSSFVPSARMEGICCMSAAHVPKSFVTSV